MRQIASRENPSFKQWLRLAQNKSGYQRKQGLIWLEGIHLCQSWLQHYEAIDTLLLSEEHLDRPEIQQLRQQIPAEHCVRVPFALMRQLSQVEQSQGVAMVVQRPMHAPRSLQRRALLLDRIQDPGNLGTLLRTAAAVGIEQVYLSSGCTDVWGQKVLRSGQGAHFALALYEGVDLAALIQTASVEVYATSLAPQSQSLYQHPLSAQAAWIFGNEGQGVHPDLQALCAQQLFIPQSAAVESLNVAIAAAVCLFEQYRQQRTS